MDFLNSVNMVNFIDLFSKMKPAFDVLVRMYYHNLLIMMYHFVCIFRFNLIIFYKEFLCVYSSEVSVCSFFIFVFIILSISLPGFDIRVMFMLAHKMSWK